MNKCMCMCLCEKKKYMEGEEEEEKKNKKQWEKHFTESAFSDEPLADVGRNHNKPISMKTQASSVWYTK